MGRIEILIAIHYTLFVIKGKKNYFLHLEMQRYKIENMHLSRYKTIAMGIIIIRHIKNLLTMSYV